MAHHEFIDRIVDHLLQQDVYSVVMSRSIAQFTDVHAWPKPDMFLRLQRLNRLFRIGFCLDIRHTGAKIQNGRGCCAGELLTVILTAGLFGQFEAFIQATAI